MITIVDYGSGNLRSIANMLKRVGQESLISDRLSDVMEATKLILPGVGHFDFGMKSLRRSGLLEAIQEKVLEKRTSLLGICLGAQLLTRRSDEGMESGLGWIDADTVAFNRARLLASCRIPHMGWSEVDFSPSERLFRNVGDKPRFYFVHSFHLECDSKETEICHACHGYRFVAGIKRENIMGVQFHPEKSHRFGMQLLRNFAELGALG